MRLFIPTINGPTGYIIYVSARPVPGISDLHASDSQGRRVSGCLSVRQFPDRQPLSCFPSNLTPNVSTLEVPGTLCLFTLTHNFPINYDSHFQDPVLKKLF